MKSLNRTHPRLKEYDYRAAGAYFITICAVQFQHLFGKIVVSDGNEAVKCRLSLLGEAIQSEILNFNSRYPYALIVHHVIMPNHLHLMLEIGDDMPIEERVPVPQLIGMLKSSATRSCKAAGYQGERIFQPSFYEHVVRSDREYTMICQYIESNPAKWAEDKYYSVGS